MDKLTPELLVSAYFRLDDGLEGTCFYQCSKADANILVRGEGEEEEGSPEESISQDDASELGTLVQSVAGNLRNIADGLNSEAETARKDAKRMIKKEAFNMCKSGDVEVKVFFAAANMLKDAILNSPAVANDSTQVNQAVVGTVLEFTRSLCDDATGLFDGRPAEIFANRLRQHTVTYLKEMWSDVKDSLVTG